MNISLKLDHLRRLIKKSVVLVIDYVREHKMLQSVLIFSFLFLSFYYVYFSVITLASSDDHFFHIRFAETIRENGLLNSFYDFKSIYFSKHAQGQEYFIYYNFLFYILLLPFTYLQPLFLGIKLYAVFATSLAFSIFYWCLKKMEVQKPFLWTVISVSILSTSLLWRFFLTRPYTLAPILLILLLYFLYKRKYWAVFLISFLYLFWHSSTFYFPFLIIFSYYIFEKFYGEKGDYKNVLWGVAGVVASLGFVYLIAPDFLLFIYDTVFSIYKETILGNKVNIAEGNELYKMDFFDFAKESALFFGFFLLSTTLFVCRYVYSKLSHTFTISHLTDKEKDKVILRGSLFFIAFVFFIGMFFASRRFGDFFTFFGLMFICISLSDMFKHFNTIDKMTKKSLVVGIFVVFGYLFSSNLLFLQERFAFGAPPFLFQKTGEWINTHIKQGEVIYNASWNWFPQLYYFAPKHNYISGLEPRFLYEYNHELYWKWVHISENGFLCNTEVCDKEKDLQKKALRKEVTKDNWYLKEGNQIADVLINDFKTHYIIISKELSSIKDLMDNNSRFEKVFSDRESLFIYKVK